MPNYYRSSRGGYPRYKAAETPQGAIADILGERRKARYKMEEDQAKEQNIYTRERAMEQERHKNAVDLKNIKTPHEQFTENHQKKNKVKWPNIGEMALLKTGKVPKPQMDKMGWTEDDAKSFIQGIASKYGWEPQEVNDMASAGNGFLGFGAHGPNKTKIVYAPPAGREADTSADTSTEEA